MTDSKNIEHNGKRLRKLLRLLLGIASVLFLIVSALRELNLLRVQSGFYLMMFFLLASLAYVGSGVAVWTKRRTQVSFRPIRWFILALLGPLLAAVVAPACLFLFWREMPQDLQVAGTSFQLFVFAGLGLTLYNWITWVLVLSSKN